MSERINTHDNRATIRWKLLTGASTLVLTACIAHVSIAKAEDATQPMFWITLGGQFAQQKNDEEVFVPPFMLASPFGGAAHAGLEKAPPTMWDESAALTFRPDDSDWVFSAAIQFGKTSRSENRDQHISHVPYKYFYKAYQNPSSHSSEGHTILDFQAGKDVGLGSFGNHGSSIFSAGVRIAQFNSRNHAEIKSQPTNCGYCVYYRFYASFDGRRSFNGIGPSLSWDGSSLIAGNPSGGGISLDWGVNGAALFGKQKMFERHQTTKNHVTHSRFHDTNVYQNTPTPVSRSKNAIVPNLGGFAGVSFRYANAKVTLGYRADMFFGAIDGGIAARKSEDRGFYGPFASVSVGIGG
jgi:hypothetical protein